MRTYQIQLTEAEAVVLDSVLVGTGATPEAWIEEAAVTAIESATRDRSYRAVMRECARDRMQLLSHG